MNALDLGYISDSDDDSVFKSQAHAGTKPRALVPEIYHGGPKRRRTSTSWVACTSQGSTSDVELVGSRFTATRASLPTPVRGRRFPLAFSAKLDLDSDDRSSAAPKSCTDRPAPNIGSHSQSTKTSLADSEHFDDSRPPEAEPSAKSSGSSDQFRNALMADREKTPPSRSTDVALKSNELFARDCGRIPGTQQNSENVDSELVDLETDSNSKSSVYVGSRPEEGYTLRDLRRIVSAMLPRYGHLLSSDEHVALASFSQLPLRAQQLYARLLSRKWPQWVRLDGLGERYSELGEAEARAAIAELSAPQPGESLDLTGTQEPVDVSSLFSPVAPWVLDSASESATSLLTRELHRLGEGSASNEDSYGTLLLEAQPVADLRKFARSLGVSEMPKGRHVKGQFLAWLVESARRQRLLGATNCLKLKSDGEARLVEQALCNGRWICIAPTPGRQAFSLLSDLFHLESQGVAESSFLVFSTRWPKYSFEECATLPLFADRAALDAFLAARLFSVRLEQLQERPTAEEASLDALCAEEKLRNALEAAKNNSFETAKASHPFRRRFTTAWCWAEALHHAVMHAPAVHDEVARDAKIRRLRLLLDSYLCISRRGRWYSELAKELARAQGPVAALGVAAHGLAEGQARPIAARITVDLVDSSQEDEASPSERQLPCLPQDVRWDLAKRCRTLAQKSAGAKACKRAWERVLREMPAAKEKACGSDDDGRWLPALVTRLLAEEAAAPGIVKSISCASIALPSEDVGGRRLYDRPDFKELTVEELAMQHYFKEVGFDSGIHCEGALLRDLFGILLFSELFDTSAEGVFMSAYQDAPLDLGTEVFYPSRRGVIEKRLGVLASLKASELTEEVNARFAELHGTKIRGVQWDRYVGPEGTLLPVQGASSARTLVESSGKPKLAESKRGLCLRSDDIPLEECCLGAAAGAIGGLALAAALRLLCMDYNSAGLPDLLVWSAKKGRPPRACFVEVKSERDSLSRRQRLWLATLRGAGAEAEVCHVRDGSAGRDSPSE
eukprot:TRINITY_DN8309_c1_g1_i1.p1 TRINITY_DN8309_c1_g1~~TRINITY_DN8309_c1_g1_i1.p1  ORF type:complete len:1018 (-),score=173.19 TRINITY_DN8309_c1_g1_i1:156-3209(-)